MLDGSRDNRVSDTGKGASGVVLGVAEVGGGVPEAVGGLELALGVAEGAKLDGHAGADAQQRRQRALVKRQRALLRVDRPRRVQRRRVRRPRLQPHLHDVEWLAWFVRAVERVSLFSLLGCLFCCICICGYKRKLEREREVD